jgi:hypothetical protein
VTLAVGVANDPYPIEIVPLDFPEFNPERVVASTMRLVLSPNAAGGAPWSVRISRIVLAEIWFEKIRLCWSEIGCPSMLKDVSACSPSGWNTPFESAATPGVVKVNIELNAAFTLSPGKL